MDPNSPEKDPLESLEERLYKRDASFQYKKQELKKRFVDAPRKWVGKQEVTAKVSNAILSETSPLLKIFYLSLLFFVCALGISAYFVWIKPRLTSPEKIDIFVEAPANVQGGEEVPIQILIGNNNDVGLEAVTLKVVLPEGVYRKEDPENTQYTTSIGPVGAGQRISHNVSLVFLGEENTEKNIQMVLEYRVKGSSATFSKEKEYSVLLVTSPVSLSVSLPPEVNAHEDFSIVISATSNLKDVLPGFLVSIEYPIGFTVQSVSPRATFRDTIWSLGDLAPRAEKRITITGHLEGQAGEDRIFKILVGTKDDKDERKIGLLYNSFTKTVQVKEPFVAIDFGVNGDTTSQEVISASGKTSSGEIAWRNTTGSNIVNGEISLVLSGAALNEVSVSADKGFYRSGDNTIIWNQTTDRTLALIEPGSTGSVRFSFNTLALTGQGNPDLRNPSISMELIFRGERVSPGFPNEPIIITQSKTIKLASAIALDAYALYSSGVSNPFTNSGPLPPKTETPTTYTVIWSLTNLSNQITDATVKASLPLYVRWLGKVAPQGEVVSFNDLTGEITWTIGSISPGAGITSTPKQVAFQIELVPSVTHINTTPLLVSQTEFSGIDAFTGSELTEQATSLDTLLSRDPSFGANAVTKARIVE